MRELRRERRYVRHEMLKAKNIIISMMGRMFGTILFVRTFPVSSPLASRTVVRLVCERHGMHTFQCMQRTCTTLAAGEEAEWVSCSMHCLDPHPPQLFSTSWQCDNCLCLQARTLVGGYSLVFDRIRVSQSLRLQICNMLCYVPMEVTSHATPQHPLHSIAVGLGMHEPPELVSRWTQASWFWRKKRVHSCAVVHARGPP